MLVRDLLLVIESIAPVAYQESYDNSGLLTGSPDQKVEGLLVCLDCTEAVVEEAVQKKCNVILAHHPVIFGGLKKLTGANAVERTVIAAIKQDIAILACHTNLDNVSMGVNAQIASKLGLINNKILLPKEETLSKLCVYIPNDSFERVSRALFEAGCGNIGHYSFAGFSDTGIGTFMGDDTSNPTIGKPNQLEKVEETKFETIFASYLQRHIESVLKEHHPYEEVAYQIIPIRNTNAYIGSGMIGEIAEEMNAEDFLKHLKRSMGLEVLKYTPVKGKKVRKVALCGGSGSFLLKQAIRSGADVFISADFKYHDYFQAEGKIIVADIGHYESEVFTKDLLIELLSKKITTFAPLLSEINTNPIKYFY